MSFKGRYSYEERKKESLKVTSRYPDKVPVIVERAASADANMPEIDRKKYLVPPHITVGQFVYTIRKRIKLKPETALFLFINNTLVPNSALIINIYDEKCDNDGFLYVIYSSENTFG
jgi:GABA(A) receptor-associated protein